MDTIKVHDKEFRVSIPEAEILEQVARVASEINRDHAGETPVFLAVLNGSFVFAADLLREVKLPCEISFVKMTSYAGTNTTGEVHDLIGLNVDITNRPVIIVEDIIDTGCTMIHMLEVLSKYQPKSVDICTLFLKPDKLQLPLKVRYRAYEIPNDFIVGYGLDYDQHGRNLRDIYTVKE